MSQTLTKSDAAPELSLEEWFSMPEDEPGEFVDGRLVEEEMPSYVHEILVIWLGRILGNWISPRGGFVGGSDAKFAVGTGRGRKPDLTVYLPGSPLPPPRGLIEQPPDVAVEVVSPTPRDGRRDRVEKLAEYAAFGIRYYWIVDPGFRSIEIFELEASGNYSHVLGATGGVVEPVPGCEGLRLDLDELWAEADRLEQAATEPS